MKEGRRGFLKKLGIVAAAAPMAAIPAMAAPVVPTETPVQAFRYQCDCGHEVVAPLPPVGTKLDFTCEQCGQKKHMELHAKGWHIWDKYPEGSIPTHGNPKPVLTSELAEDSQRKMLALEGVETLKRRVTKG